MKNLLIILGICLGLGFSTANAQDDPSHNNDGEFTKAESQADHQDKSKAGNTLHKTGSKVGGAAKWTGKKVGDGAKWTGKKVGDGASWTWGKAKHNKVTKNIFNQPDKDAEASREVEVEADRE